MTALAGGAADKLGNRYEHWWTAWRIADLLEGKVCSIRLEPPGPAGEGVEFVVEGPDGDVGEQAKGTTRSWTLPRLRTEGVLAAAAAQLSRNLSYRLVTAAPAEKLHTLSDRARAAGTVEDHESVLGGRHEDLDLVCSAWGVDRETGWRMLRRVHVEQHPEDSLRSMTESRWERFYVDDPTMVLGAVKVFCDDHLHRTVTAPQVRSHLDALGFRRAFLSGDPRTLECLTESVEEQRRAVAAVAPSRRVPRSVSAETFHVLQEDERRVLVLDGDAGTGKSAVASEIGRLAMSEGWLVAMVRLDGMSSDVRSSRALGQQTVLGDCPVTLLAGVAGARASLLVVDQLDAVSTHSGRMPDSFLAVDDVLERARSAPELRVLLVVRTVDLRADPRLRTLAADDRRVVGRTVGLLSREDVENCVSAPTFGSLDEVTRELLRTPLHLAVFLGLVERRPTSYRTLTDLYDAYTEQRRARLDREIGGGGVWAVFDVLVKAMTDRATLTAPFAVLDACSHAAVGAVESAGLIVVDEGHTTVRFFHETYLDHVFARWFLREGRDLHDYLVSSGQALFQRAPTRQVLALLAAADRPRFRTTVERLLTSSGIRAHLKMLVIDVLTSLDAEPADWERLEPLAWADAPIARRVRGLLACPAWFEAADHLGRWEQWLRDPSRVDDVFPQLARCARFRPARADALVRSFIGRRTGWPQRFQSLVSWSLCPELVDLTSVLYERGDLDVEGDGADVSVAMQPVNILDEDEMASAAPLLGAWLRRGTVLAREQGGVDPFAVGVLVSSSSDEATVREIARSAPRAFVAEVLPVIVQMTLIELRPGRALFPRSRYAARFRGSAHGVDRALFHELEEALQHLAGEDLAACDAALARLVGHDSDELQFLACRTLTVRGSADAAIEWLLNDERRFYLGWSDNLWWAARELLEAWSPTCSPQTYERLEAVVLAHRSPAESLGHFGRTQHELLSGMAPDRLSDLARRRLDELERRFPPPRPARPITAEFVGSPIPEDASAAMSDDQWLSALRKHDTDELRFDDDLRRIGGARELAVQLGRRAADEPARYARLALRFDATVPASAFDHLVRSVAGKVDAELLLDVCEHARDLHGAAVGLGVCWALRDSGAAGARFVALLADCAQDLDPLASDAALRSESDLLTAGLNCTRGAAAVAVARALFTTAADVDTLLPVVERLASDDAPQVRAVAAEAVLALMNHSEQRALENAFDLLSDPQTVLAARTAALLLRHCVARAPQMFSAVLNQGLRGAGDSSHHAGQVWAAALLYADLPGGVVTDVTMLPVDARRGAAEVFASDPGASLGHLTVLADDTDDTVLSTVGRSARHLQRLTDPQFDGLINVLLVSEATEASLEPLLDALEDSSRLPPAALEACEMAVSMAGDDAADMRSGHAALAHQALTLALRLYRSGDERVRSRCLDVVDDLSAVGAYGLSRALKDER